MVWTTCRGCGKQCDLPEPSETDNPLVAGKCIDCIKKMQDKHDDELLPELYSAMLSDQHQKKKEEWFS